MKKTSKEEISLHCLTILMASLIIVSQNVKSEETGQQIEYRKSSDPAAFQTFSQSQYSKDTVFFAKLNEESDTLMVSLEYPAVRNSSNVLTISKWLPSGEREIVWQPKKTEVGFSYKSILVGDMDNDPYDEILIFSNHYGSMRPDLFLIEWVEDDFEVIKHSTEAPHAAAALIDVDQDGINEVVFATIRTDVSQGGENWYPSMRLQIYTVGQTLEKIQEITLEDEASVRSLVTHDLNGDGYKEIITVEYTPGLELEGQLSIYATREMNRIVRVHVENHFFPSQPRYIDLFDHKSATYMFVELQGLRWKSILRWQGLQYPLEERWGNTDIREFHLFEEAWQRHLVLNPLNKVVEKYRAWWTVDIRKTVYVARDVDDVRTGTPYQIFLDQ